MYWKRKGHVWSVKGQCLKPSVNLVLLQILMLNGSATRG